jgi:hypothetical protein
MNRYGLGSSQVGRLIGKDHSTAIWANKQTRTMLEIKDDLYINEIVRWAEVFDEVLPNGELSNIIIQQRVDNLLDSLTNDIEAKINALEDLLKKYKDKYNT